MLGLSSRDTRMVVVLLCGTLLAVLNQTLLSPALPAIMADMQVTATTVQWLTSGYSLVEAIIIPLSAFLIGRFSTRKLFIGGITLFGIGSLLAAISPSFAILLLGRCCQAAATGVVMPMVFTLIVLVFPRERRGQAMGIVSLIISFAPAVGPSLSGLLVDYVGWRMLFVIVSCLSFVVIMVGIFVLRNWEGFERTTFDLLSVIMSSIGMVCLLYGFSTFSSAENLALTGALIVVGAVFLALFVYRQTKLEVPLLNVRVLKSRRYRTVVILVFIMQCALVGSGVVMPIYLQSVLGQSATMCGLLMLPGAVLGAFCSLIAGNLFDRYGIRYLAIGGGAVIAIGGLGMSFFGMDTSLLLVLFVYSALVMGMSFLMTPLNTWGINSLDNSVIQHGNAVTNTINQVGGSFGTAVIVSLSAMSYLVAPDAAGVEAICAGQHVSFVAMSAILVVVFLLIVIMVKDKKSDVQPVQVRHDIDEPVKASDRFWLVRDVMNEDYHCIENTATVGEAIALLTEKDTSGLAIVDSDRKVVGFLSDGDIMKGLAKEERTFSDGVNLIALIDNKRIQEKAALLLAQNVMTIATKKPIVVEDTCPLQDAVKVLSDKRIK